MSEILNRLSKCERVIEWVDPWDPRLVQATGLPAPQRGGADRMGWSEDEADWPNLVTELSRIIGYKDRVIGRVEGDEDWATVILDFPSLKDWTQCFPVSNERTRLGLPDADRVAWAAVGKCAMEIGLGVFAELQPRGQIEVRVQHIPEEVVSFL